MSEQQSPSNLDIQRFIKKYNIKSSKRQLKSDFASGTINGVTFGLCYSFYFMPIEFNEEIRLTKFRGSKILYTLSHCLRFGILFGAIRTIMNGIQRQELQTNQALAYKCGSLLIAMFII